MVCVWLHSVSQIGTQDSQIKAQFTEKHSRVLCIWPLLNFLISIIIVRWALCLNWWSDEAANLLSSPHDRARTLSPQLVLSFTQYKAHLTYSPPPLYLLLFILCQNGIRNYSMCQIYCGAAICQFCFFSFIMLMLQHFSACVWVGQQTSFALALKVAA